jgi:cysteine synthase
LDKSLVEDYILVSDEEAVKTARELVSTEGIFTDYSSGANVAAALRLIHEGKKYRSSYRRYRIKVYGVKGRLSTSLKTKVQ